MIGRQAALAAVASWSARFTSLTIAFLLTPFLLHRLGDAQYGLFMLLTALIGQSTLIDLSSAVIKYVAESRARGDNDRVRSVVATALVIHCCLGLLALLVTAVLAPIFPDLFNVATSERDTATTVAWLMGIWLAISFPCSASWAVLWGLHKYGLANAINVLATLVQAAVTVVILVLGGGLVQMVAATIPVTLVMQAITICCIYRVAPEIRFGRRAFRGGLVRTLLSFSASMFAQAVAHNVQAKSDEIIIGALLPMSSVAPYSIARRVGEVPKLVAEQSLAGFLPLHRTSRQMEVRIDCDHCIWQEAALFLQCAYRSPAFSLHLRGHCWRFGLGRHMPVTLRLLWF